MKRAFLLGSVLLGTLLLASPGAFAQRGGNNGLNFWKCTLPGGGVYEVALRSITAIGVQVYYVEGGIQITELSVDTTGNTEARFYAMQTSAQAAAAGMGGPASSAVDAVVSHGQEAANRAATVAGGTVVSDALNNAVVKSYPATTHAHTVEYRVATPDEATALFNSVESSWKNNVNSTYPPPPTTATGT